MPTGACSDAFALNIGKEDWQLRQVKNCFDAAHGCEGSFRLFMSFDMSFVLNISLATSSELIDFYSSFAASKKEDVHPLLATMSEVALSPAYLHYKGKALVSTFAGESSLFGFPDISSAWSYVKARMEEVCPVGVYYSLVKQRQAQ